MIQHILNNHSTQYKNNTKISIFQILCTLLSIHILDPQSESLNMVAKWTF